MAEVKFLNRWDVKGIEVVDPGLKAYVTLEPKIAPKTGARYARNRFYKSKVFIVERLINKIMIPGHKGKKHLRSSGNATGKANTAINIVEKAFEEIEKQTKENPIKVFVKALENASQREEIITIEYGGARYPKAVECAPQRRVDLALRYMAQGAFQKSFNSKKTVISCLADEILNAYRMSSGSSAIAKKLEVERQADSSR